ncbi:MAG: 1-(5-phosphoribosyl)-5-[(5-phosphoribosylamino)methylideneamino]imidazole-4-carboxamide isomerase [Thermoleophilaceae bacterium]|nr:1-(5-phosphoribosyl)-5-[(5-phosphoribosylamino)methylideneamino]imidazole-4-carboxamide isomerase [Thermoleophilaceae bacterium]
MILLPAIDIRGGRAVRLRQGDFDAETVYADDPLAAALAWVESGAEALHVVDLDGARDGAPANLDHLARIAEAVGVPIQYGGGLRTRDAIDDAIAAGAERVVLGTVALRDPELLALAVADHGPRIVVGVDARGGAVSVAGWTETTGQSPEDVVARLDDAGVETFVYTDVDRDGMLDGPDLDGLLRVAEATSGRVISSGGVGRLDDLRALAGLGIENLYGVISGKALYEGRFTVREAREALAP